MVTTHKAESENEGIWDKVRARATVATDPGKGMAELGQQIAKLMAAQIKAGQGSNPSSMPSSPQERGHATAYRNMPLISQAKSWQHTSIPYTTLEPSYHLHPTTKLFYYR